jgi:hypothetical protein
MLLGPGCAGSFDEWRFLIATAQGQPEITARLYAKSPPERA